MSEQLEDELLPVDRRSAEVYNQAEAVVDDLLKLADSGAVQMEMDDAVSTVYRCEIVVQKAKLPDEGA